MQLTPHYGPASIIQLAGDPSAIAEPAIRQHRRLAATLASLPAAQWSAPSRCDGWTARDVAIHLDSVHSFWAYSIGAGLRGEPTRFLATFDPVASPAQLVEGQADISHDDVLERFVASTAQLTSLLESLDDDAWTALAEAPPGHVTVSALVHHALWDSWIHERDIALPLGLEPDVEPDEVAACLRYVAALAPALAFQRLTERGRFSVDVVDPDVAFTVEVADHVAVLDGCSDTELCFTGASVGLLEALSFRAPLVQDVPATSSWMVRGLAETFDHELA